MEKPILFSSEMVRAILDGRKTQTRRVIKPQPMFSNVAINGMTLEQRIAEEKAWLIANKCPYGKPGDLLWVRETWLELEKSHWCDTGKPESWFDDCYGRVNAIAYRAGITQDGEDARQEYGYKWRPSIHMPRWASRLTLRVVDVRIERVQEITPEAVAAEGCPTKHHMDNCLGFSHAMHAWFEHLWDGINAKRSYSWDSNPWVWVVEFEVVK